MRLRRESYALRFLCKFMIDVDYYIGSDCTKAHIDTSVASNSIVNVSSVEENRKTNKKDSE